MLPVCPRNPSEPCARRKRHIYSLLIHTGFYMFFRRLDSEDHNTRKTSYISMGRLVLRIIRNLSVSDTITYSVSTYVYIQAISLPVIPPPIPTSSLAATASPRKITSSALRRLLNFVRSSTSCHWFRTGSELLVTSRATTSSITAASQGQSNQRHKKAL
ncbi:hypothetical protein F4780DRAFT_128769 [Xylariomycetidae sp. FL0641]|nr:hypothetical protein F4780DRAFT_128769 [Xylariomycetidae sp. FL0641]